MLDIPLPELQGLKTLKVAFHHGTKDEVDFIFILPLLLFYIALSTSGLIIDFFRRVYHVQFCQLSQVAIHSIRLPKNSIVADVINDLKTKVM